MTAILLVGKLTLVLLLALVLDLALRRRAVLACAAMWNAALVSLVLLPAAVLFVAALPVAIAGQSVPKLHAPAAAGFVPEHMPVSAIEPSIENYGIDQRAEEPSPAPVEKAWPIPSAGWLLAAL